MIDLLASSREYLYQLMTDVFEYLTATTVHCTDVHDIVQTNFELGVKIPLIIRSPWMASSVGKTAFALVEMVDVVSFLYTRASQWPRCTLHVQ